MTAKLTLVLAASKESMPLLTQAVDDFARQHGLDQRTTHDTQLALEEVVHNVIVHGHREQEQETVVVRLTLLSDELLLEVEDTAPPFNPLEHADPDLDLPPEDRQIGGLGIFLVRRIMDRVEYQFQEGRNHLIMGKKLAKA